MNEGDAVAGSFRDPASHVELVNERLVRRFTHLGNGIDNYHMLMESGLYDSLVDAKLLVTHDNMSVGQQEAEIYPERIPFISYPYEWCFSQLRDAALLTLSVQEYALRHGMSLKDASAYNVQWKNGGPIFIDTGSFEKYVAGQPWKAYGQFCRHFLAPLALMSYCDLRLGQLLQRYLDGIPIDLAVRLLPAWRLMRPGLFIHLFSQVKLTPERRIHGNRVNVTMNGIMGLVDSLTRLVASLQPPETHTTWSEYDTAHYTPIGMGRKASLVSQVAASIAPGTIWDLGANQGVFSRIMSGLAMLVVSMDADPVAVEWNYHHNRLLGETRILPLVMDITNPLPGAGWDLTERSSIFDRGRADMVVALALIHHLAIGNNVPLDRIAQFLSRTTRDMLLVEWVPRNDPQVVSMMAAKQMTFPGYTEECFLSALAPMFSLVKANDIPMTEGHNRILMQFRKRAISIP